MRIQPLNTAIYPHSHSLDGQARRPRTETGPVESRRHGRSRRSKAAYWPLVQ